MTEAAILHSESDASDDNSVVTIDANEAKVKQATIADNCDDVLAFLQAVAIKYHQVIAAPFSLRVDKRTQVWFQRWTDVNLPKPPKPAPQYHLGLTGILTNVTTRLHTAEALHPVVSTQREAEKETKGWDPLPPTSQRAILAASATTRTSVPTSPPPTIHLFLNSRNVRLGLV